MSQDQYSWKILIALVILSSLARFSAFWILGDGLNSDRDNYRRLAETLRRTGIYGWETTTPAGHLTVRPTAFRPPLYPYVLAVLFHRGAVSAYIVGALHLLLGAATVVITFLLAQHYGLGRWSVLAGGLVACDPILVVQSSQVMTETLATFLAAGCLLCLARFNHKESLATAGVAGGMIGLAVLCRPTFLFWFALTSVVIVIRSAHRHRFLYVMAFIGCAMLILSPWSARNYVVFQRAIIATTHGGYTFLLANNPSFYDGLRNGAQDTWDSRPLSEAWQLRWSTQGPDDRVWSDLSSLPRSLKIRNHPDRSEIDDDRFAYRLALRYIREQPAMFVYSCWIRVARLWRLTPHRLNPNESAIRVTARIAAGVWYASMFGLAMLKIVTLKSDFLRAPWLWGVLLCVSFSGVHCLFWSDMRMRAPLMPFVSILAAAGAARLTAQDVRHK